jgi:NDMA-dependent alcohol dehydrogenase
MQARGAVCRGAGEPWEVTDLDLEPPRQDELLIQIVASGVCHSDDHYRTGAFVPSQWPICAGHEGAGIVEEVGPHTYGWEVGDHVVLQFFPSCGRCRFCARGQHNLCNDGARFPGGVRADGTYRLSERGEPVAQGGGISTFANYSVVHVNSAIKISRELPLDKSCLVGCGVSTGFGSAVNSANVRAGDCVIVMGVGGVGMNAVQGARLQGALHVVAVDPVEFKRDVACTLGATQAFADIEAAVRFVHSVTNGQGADAAIVCIGNTTGAHIAEAFEAVRKGGVVVATGVSDPAATGIPVSPTMMTLYQKQIKGSLYGEMNPVADIPRLLELYSSGQLRLDELVTKTYSLDEINMAFDDMLEGRNVRGVILHEH